jgi:hypothetical protein
MRTTKTASHAGLVAAIAGLLACSSTTAAPPPDGLLPLGTWGGENAGMIVGDTAMHLHVGCTFGDVSGRVPVGTTGSFDIQGSYTLRAFPIVLGPSVPARFTGKVSGATATVTVTVNDTVEKKTVVLGPVVVTLGVDPKMGPCPICRRPIRTAEPMSGPREELLAPRADLDRSWSRWEQIVVEIRRAGRKLFHKEDLNSRLRGER